MGDEDQPRIFAAADLLEKELPNERKVVMHGTAHLPNMERPEEFNRLVLEFLQDHHKVRSKALQPTGSGLTRTRRNFRTGGA